MLDDTEMQEDGKKKDMERNWGKKCKDKSEISYSDNLSSFILLIYISVYVFHIIGFFPRWDCSPELKPAAFTGLPIETGPWHVLCHYQFVIWATQGYTRKVIT